MICVSHYLPSLQDRRSQQKTLSSQQHLDVNASDASDSGNKFAGGEKRKCTEKCCFHTDRGHKCRSSFNYSDTDTERNVTHAA